MLSILIVKKMDEKLLIFDFDGTIADTKSLYYQAISDELVRWGFSEMQIDRAIDMGTSLRKTLKGIGLNFIVSWWLHHRILKRIKIYVNQVKKCHDASHVAEIKGKKILVTNSLKEFVLPVLKHLKLQKEFSEIYGADDFLDKSDFISSYLKRNKIDRNDSYYIGDRVADVKIARKVGCVSVIISGKCSWNSRAMLIKARPDFLLDDLKDVGEIVR